jgi:hypothetical protein
MKLKFVVFLLIFSIALSAALFVFSDNLLANSTASERPTFGTVLSEKVFNLGGENIRFLIRNPNDQSGVLYFNMHDNENTCVAATDSLLTRAEGKFIELKYKGSRRVGGFTKDRKQFWIDPNRIYTDLGIYKTLQMHNTYSVEAKKQVRLLSEFIVDSLLAEADFIVAVHNNSKGYSIEKYMPDSAFHDSAEKVHYNRSKSPHDFFYVNDPAHFEYFKNMGYNTILQSKNPDDDGSLSVYCANKNIPYINIEALEGHFAQQLDMLMVLQKLLKDRN